MHQHCQSVICKIAHVAGRPRNVLALLYYFSAHYEDALEEVNMLMASETGALAQSLQFVPAEAPALEDSGDQFAVSYSSNNTAVCGVAPSFGQ